jgi:hypothetical protein
MKVKVGDYVIIKPQDRDKPILCTVMIENDGKIVTVQVNHEEHYLSEQQSLYFMDIDFTHYQLVIFEDGLFGNISLLDKAMNLKAYNPELESGCDDTSWCAEMTENTEGVYLKKEDVINLFTS